MLVAIAATAALPILQATIKYIVIVQAPYLRKELGRYRTGSVTSAFAAKDSTALCTPDCTYYHRYRQRMVYLRVMYNERAFSTTFQ